MTSAGTGILNDLGSLVAEIGSYSLIGHTVNSRKSYPFELDDLICHRPDNTFTKALYIPVRCMERATGGISGRKPLDNRGFHRTGIRKCVPGIGKSGVPDDQSTCTLKRSFSRIILLLFEIPGLEEILPFQMLTCGTLSSHLRDGGVHVLPLRSHQRLKIVRGPAQKRTGQPPGQ